MIVVLVILSVLVTLAVPKLVGNQERQFNLAVDQTADLLTMYAQRENLSGKVVGLWHDRERNTISLQALDTRFGDVDEAAEWRTDFFTPAVKMPSFMTDADVEFFADGERYDAAEWPLATNIGEDRPRIDITLRGPTRQATLSLSPHGVSPLVVNGEQVTGVRGVEPWAKS